LQSNYIQKMHILQKFCLSYLLRLLLHAYPVQQGEVDLSIPVPAILPGHPEPGFRARWHRCNRLGSDAKLILIDFVPYSPVTVTGTFEVS